MLGGIALTAALLVAGAYMPKWLTFLITMAASHGLVSLGIVLMMRGGVVSFGQGLVFALGAYAAALAYTRLGITDALGPHCSAARSRRSASRRSRRCCRATAVSSSRC